MCPSPKAAMPPSRGSAPARKKSPRQPRVMPMARHRLSTLTDVPRVNRYQLQAATTNVSDEPMRVQVGMCRLRSSFSLPKAKPPKSKSAQRKSNPRSQNCCAGLARGTNIIQALLKMFDLCFSAAGLALIKRKQQFAQQQRQGLLLFRCKAAE